MNVLHNLPQRTGGFKQIFIEVCCAVLSHLVMSDSVTPMVYTIHGILQARKLEWIAFPFFRGLPNPGIKPRCPLLQADSLSAEPQGKPKKTGVGSLSLLQGIFLTQESNRGLLHCRQTVYQLSYQGKS